MIGSWRVSYRRATSEECRIEGRWWECRTEGYPWVSGGLTRRLEKGRLEREGQVRRLQTLEECGREDEKRIEEQRLISGRLARASAVTFMNVAQNVVQEPQRVRSESVRRSPKESLYVREQVQCSRVTWSLTEVIEMPLRAWSCAGD